MPSTVLHWGAVVVCLPPSCHWKGAPQGLLDMLCHANMAIAMRTYCNVQHLHLVCTPLPPSSDGHSNTGTHVMLDLGTAPSGHKLLVEELPCSR